MANQATATTEIRQIASYQVKPEALDRCLAAIREFVA
jgi:hypothetical protein